MVELSGMNILIKNVVKNPERCIFSVILSRLPINPLSVRWTSRSRSSRSTGGTVWPCRRRSLCSWPLTSTAGWTSLTQRWSFRPRSEPDRETGRAVVSRLQAGSVGWEGNQCLNMVFSCSNRLIKRTLFNTSSYQRTKMERFWKLDLVSFRRRRRLTG